VVNIHMRVDSEEDVLSDFRRITGVDIFTRLN
jgi:hypothetical protein